MLRQLVPPAHSGSMDGLLRGRRPFKETPPVSPVYSSKSQGAKVLLPEFIAVTSN
jgi:hypothetical protein